MFFNYKCKTKGLAIKKGTSPDSLLSLYDCLVCYLVLKNAKGSLNKLYLINKGKLG